MCTFVHGSSLCFQVPCKPDTPPGECKQHSPKLGRMHTSRTVVLRYIFATQCFVREKVPALMPTHTCGYLHRFVDAAGAPAEVPAEGILRQRLR